MSSGEEREPGGLAEELERRDRKAERQETAAIAIDAAVAVVAVISVTIWVLGGSIADPAWAVIAAVLAVANIYAQRLIRLLRRHARELRQHADRAYELLHLLRR